MYRKFRNWFIGDYLKKTEDVFEQAKIITLFNFICLFAIVLLVPIIEEARVGMRNPMLLHLLAYFGLLYLPFSLKRTQNVRLITNVYVTICIVINFFIALFFYQHHVDSTLVSWAVFNLVFIALLTEGRERIIFTVFAPSAVIYSLVNIQTGGAFDIPLIYEGYNEPPQIIMIIPVSLIVYTVWSYSATGAVAQKSLKKQKAMIEEQKEVVDEQNKEILDSITYAKRIQSAILPPDKVVKEYLKESFILYKPKDIVAGDFYWMEHKEGKILFAAADCTGHGVPGAMVSVVCNNALNRAVREHGLTEPGEILGKTRDIVKQEFEKSDEEVKDGMDIALCSLKGNKLQYAGANNPLWILRKGEIMETKANKQPIGKFDNPIPYTTHSFDLEKGDTLYIFSDGYADQFGGEKGKKFKAKAFRELLLSIQDRPMDEQRLSIDEAFEDWKGNLEQIDDVCVIGVRV